MFFDPATFPFTEVLERHWREILAEFEGVQNEMFDWYERKLYDEGTWKLFLIYSFPQAEPIGVARCPFTAEIVHRHVPKHAVVGFSVLWPGTRIKPHHGHPTGHLRAHLALQVPPGDCAITVGEETRGWEVGRMLVFDDHAWHEAWNLTDQKRVVLLFDFLP